MSPKSLGRPADILLVDDNAQVREALQSQLRRYGFEVCGQAENGADAIEKAKGMRPDVVILDLSMPVMNGIDAAKVLNGLMPEGELLLYTSHASAMLNEQAKKAGVKMVVDKSGPIEMLVSHLRRSAA